MGHVPFSKCLHKGRINSFLSCGEMHEITTLPYLIEELYLWIGKT